MAACEAAGGALEDDEVGAPAALAPAITVASWNVDCSEALAAYIATPHDATHGTWSAAQHVGVIRRVKRVIYLRSFRLAQRRVEQGGLTPHLRALSRLSNSIKVMRIVLRFVVPKYCTPTRAELGAICTMCHTSNDAPGMARWLRCGVDPNTRDVNGVAKPAAYQAPLLFIASERGQLGVISMLLRAGADVDVATMDDGTTPLFWAAQRDLLNVVTKLIAAGALVDKARTTDGCTPLYIAAQNGHLAVETKLKIARAHV